MSEVVLQASGVEVAYRQPDGSLATVVADASLSLERGRILGLAGESGCGKSTFALAAMGVPPPSGRILAGSSTIDGIDLLACSRPALRAIWGRRIAYVPQNAATALNPAIRVGRQVGQPMAVHLGMRGAKLRARVIQLLELVGIPEPARALDRFPHEFSGGQQQRIALALAVSCDPAALILDEPTTGLDVTTQARISALLKDVLEQTGAAVLYVSHDLALLSGVADRLSVMYGGEIVESGPAGTVVGAPRHPYTQALLAALPSAHERHAVAGIAGQPPPQFVPDACPFAPRCDHARPLCTAGHPPLEQIESERAVRCVRWRELDARPRDVNAWPLPGEPSGGALLELEEVWCGYRKAPEPAVRGVSLSLAPGDTLAIVGESGSGKSTLLRAIAGLHPPLRGQLRFGGRALPPRAARRSRAVRGQIQLVFQNPDTSLNPRQSVGELLTRPIRLFRSDVPRGMEQRAVAEALEQVRLPASAARRYPDELSGGQRQRVAVARAFAARPEVLLCDEVTSALDVSVQATILKLIGELTATFGTTVVFVSHDLAVVRTLCRRAIVMHEGVVCEQGMTEELFARPAHAYTQQLLHAIPTLARALTR